MGHNHTWLYKLLRQGQGPTLTPVVRSPTSDTHGEVEHFVTYDAAIAWLQARDPDRYAQAIRTLKIGRVMACVKYGLPLPPPKPKEIRTSPTMEIAPSVANGRRQWKGRIAHRVKNSYRNAYRPRLNGIDGMNW